MGKISVMPQTSSDTLNDAYIHRLILRATATPVGICPVALQLSLLNASVAQTCGKCTPCRDGLPQLVQLLQQILDCKADAQTLLQAKELATTIANTSDCAIGYDAAQAVLDGMDTFKDEYVSHIQKQSCVAGIEQKVPCEAYCPAHVNVPGYIALAAEKDFAGAINMIRKDNPFPTACAYVCEHPCELRCRRTILDAPLNIRGIKKYVVDNTVADKVSCPQASVDTQRHIAVIGAGPSGLTCAYFLALMGHSVTVFESRKKPGGMMRYGIPAYRLPREKLDEDINAICSVGNIKIKCDTNVDSEMMKEISDTFDAVYVAIGAQSAKSLKIENIDANGVMSAVDILSKLGDKDWVPNFTGKNVVVVGGGNVAMDCARTSVRAGAESVTVVYRRRVEDMTALVSEIQSAMQEGVEMCTLQSPVAIEVDANNNCTALVVQPQMISAVKNGRPAPKDANKPQEKIEADVILIAVGQDIDSAAFEDFGMKTERSRFCANKYLEADGYKNIFVGGDCQTGPATVIKAVGAGKIAARNIDEFLGYHHTLNCGVVAPNPVSNNRVTYGRVDIIERPAKVRKADFLSVETEMSDEEAVQECSRCLRCDYFGCGSQEGGREQYV